MKPYRLKREPNYDNCDHPSDMIFLMCMLEDQGEVLVSVETIEDLYYEFSARCGCSWRMLDEKVADEFAEWLDKYEL